MGEKFIFLTLDQIGPVGKGVDLYALVSLKSKGKRSTKHRSKTFNASSTPKTVVIKETFALSTHNLKCDLEDESVSIQFGNWKRLSPVLTKYGQRLDIPLRQVFAAPGQLKQFDDVQVPGTSGPACCSFSIEVREVGVNLDEAPKLLKTHTKNGKNRYYNSIDRTNMKKAIKRGERDERQQCAEWIDVRVNAVKLKEGFVQTLNASEINPYFFISLNSSSHVKHRSPVLRNTHCGQWDVTRPDANFGFEITSLSGDDQLNDLLKIELRSYRGATSLARILGKTEIDLSTFFSDSDKSTSSSASSSSSDLSDSLSDSSFCGKWISLKPLGHIRSTIGSSSSSSGTTDEFRQDPEAVQLFVSIRRRKRSTFDIDAERDKSIASKMANRLSYIISCIRARLFDYNIMLSVTIELVGLITMRASFSVEPYDDKEANNKRQQALDALDDQSEQIDDDDASELDQWTDKHMEEFKSLMEADATRRKQELNNLSSSKLSKSAGAAAKSVGNVAKTGMVKAGRMLRELVWQAVDKLLKALGIGCNALSNQGISIALGTGLNLTYLGYGIIISFDANNETGNNAFQSRAHTQTSRRHR